jgi:hypothetical protein
MNLAERTPELQVLVFRRLRIKIAGIIAKLYRLASPSESPGILELRGFILQLVTGWQTWNVRHARQRSVRVALDCRFSPIPAVALRQER